MLWDSQAWLDASLEADAEEIKQKHREVEEMCAPIVSKYYGHAGKGGAAREEEEEEEQAYDEL